MEQPVKSAGSSVLVFLLKSSIGGGPEELWVALHPRRHVRPRTGRTAGRQASSEVVAAGRRPRGRKSAVLLGGYVRQRTGRPAGLGTSPHVVKPSGSEW